MHKDIISLQKGFDSIEIPPELDLVIEAAVKRGQRVKRKQRVLRPVAVAVALIFILVLSVNLSPAFARVVGALPGMEAILNLICFDRGLVDVIDHGFGQIINKSATDKGITVTLDSAIYDGKKLILAIRMDTEKEFDRLGILDLRITDSAGKPLHGFFSVGSFASDTPNIFRALVEFHRGEDDYPRNLILECRSLEHFYGEEVFTQVREVIPGNWSIPFVLDSELAKYEPIVLDLNTEVSVGNVKFTIERLSVFPTVAELAVSMAEDNPVRITGFKNLRIVDENGNQYRFRSGTIEDDCNVYRFESNYFINPSHLTLELDGVYTLPWKDTYFVIDIANERVLEDSGLGIEFLRKDIQYDSWYDREEMRVLFTINNPEFLQAEDGFLEVDFEVQDLQGNPYYLTSYSQSLGLREFGLGFNTEVGIPETVKVRITGISKGIMEEVKVPLK